MLLPLRGESFLGEPENKRGAPTSDALPHVGLQGIPLSLWVGTVS